MADLGVLALGAHTSIATTATVGTPPVLQVIASAADGSYVHASTNTTGVYVAQFALADMPSDFGTMDSVSIRLRYLQSGLSLNTWNSLTARLFRADGTTPLSNAATVASNITATSGTTSGVINFTGVDTSANKAVWDGAVVRLSFDITRNKGGDTYSARVTAAEVTGAYTAEAVNSPPVITQEDDQIAEEGVELVVNISASDPDDDGLSYSLDEAPPGATIDPSTGVFRWTPSSVSALPIVRLIYSDVQPRTVVGEAQSVVELTLPANRRVGDLALFVLGTTVYSIYNTVSTVDPVDFTDSAKSMDSGLYYFRRRLTGSEPGTYSFELDGEFNPSADPLIGCVALYRGALDAAPSHAIEWFPPTSEDPTTFPSRTFSDVPAALVCAACVDGGEFTGELSFPSGMVERQQARTDGGLGEARVAFADERIDSAGASGTRLLSYELARHDTHVLSVALEPEAVGDEREVTVTVRVVDDGDPPLADTMTFFVVASFEAGGPPLTVQGAASAHVAESPALAQNSALAVGGTAHEHTAGGPTLSQAHLLALAGSAHLHTAGSPALSMSVSLAMAGGVHLHTAGSVDLAQGYTISPASAWHGHNVASPGLLQGYLMGINGAAHLHTAGSPTISLSITIDPTDAWHGHVAGSPALTQAHLVTVQGAFHAHTAGSVALVQAGILSTQGAVHDHTAGLVGLIQSHLLAPQNTSHAHTAQPATLVTAGALGVQGTHHVHAAGGLVLSQAHLLAIAGSAHLHTAASVALSQAFTLAPSPSWHGHAAGSPVLLQAGALGVHSTAHGHTVETIELSQGYLLALESALHQHTAQGVALTQGHVLAVAGAIHLHSAGALDLLQDSVLIVDSALHEHLATEIGLVFGGRGIAGRLIVIEGRERTYLVASTQRIYTAPANQRTFKVDA